MATSFFGGAFFGGEFFSSTPVPPTPTPTTSYGGGGYTEYDDSDRRKRWEARLKDKKELRKLIVRAMDGAKDNPETVVQAEAIAEKYTPPVTVNRPEPRIDYTKLLKDIEAVEWLLMSYDQQQRRMRDEDDDDDVILSLLH